MWGDSQNQFKWTIYSEFLKILSIKTTNVEKVHGNVHLPTTQPNSLLNVFTDFFPFLFLKKKIILLSSNSVNNKKKTTDNYEVSIQNMITCLTTNQYEHYNSYAHVLQS